MACCLVQVPQLAKHNYSSCLCWSKAKAGGGRVVMADKSNSVATEKLGIKIEKNPPESKLTQLGVRTWPK